MERGQLLLVVRMFTSTALALANVAAFIFAWADRNLSAGARGLISFGAAIFFVIVFHEAACCCRYLREARDKENEHHV